MEDRQGNLDPRLNATIVKFNELRDDWYRGADLMVRLIARAVNGAPIVFVGFPKQWGPVFAAFGVASRELSTPQKYVPLASDLSCRSLSNHDFQSRQRREVAATS
jgi:hypothetical protein